MPGPGRTNEQKEIVPSSSTGAAVQITRSRQMTQIILRRADIRRLSSCCCLPKSITSPLTTREILLQNSGSFQTLLVKHLTGKTVRCVTLADSQVQRTKFISRAILYSETSFSSNNPSPLIRSSETTLATLHLHSTSPPFVLPKPPLRPIPSSQTTFAI